MKKIFNKKIFIAFLIMIVATTTSFVVQAQSTMKQSSVNEKIKEFLKTTKIEIEDHYIEGNTSVYKVHDIDKDKYYKLASNDEYEIEWYDTVKYGKHEKIGNSLKEKVKNISKNEKIDVMVELVFDYGSYGNELLNVEEKYFKDNKVNSKEKLKDDLYNELKILKREYTKKKMIEYNKLSKDYEIINISKYSPFMFLRVSADELDDLVNEEKVYEINYLENESAQLYYDNISSKSSSGTINNNPITSTRTNIVKNSGKTGNGVKIGQLEISNPDTTNPALSGKAITKRTTNCSYDSSSVTHATEVAGVLVGTNGVAPSASLYSACWSYTTEVQSAIEWLVSQNVDIINSSAGFLENSYSAYDSYIDAITYMNDILFINAAGNRKVYNSSTGLYECIPNPLNSISSGAYAYNSLAIGNITYTGTNYVDAAGSNSYRSECSWYMTAEYGNRANKPEIVAPGTNVNYTNAYSSPTSGNSFSAPLVAGASALLMEGIPSTKNDFQSIKAALFATARPMDNYPKNWSSNSNGWLKIYNNYNSEVGLGVLDTKSAYDLLNWGQFRNVTVNGGNLDSYTYNNVLGNGMDVRVAITWSKPNTTTGINNTNNSGTDEVADIDLRIIGPNGEQIAKSISSYANVEWVNFVTAQGYGTYKFKIINWDSRGNSVPTKVSMAWW